MGVRRRRPNGPNSTPSTATEPTLHDPAALSLPATWKRRVGAGVGMRLRGGRQEFKNEALVEALFAGSDHLRAEMSRVNKIANVEGQVREALPIALGLLDKTIDAVHEFTSVPTERSGGKIAYGLGQLQLIDWEELRRRCGGVENSPVLQDLRQVLILQTEYDAQPINELCSTLEDLRSEINDLIDKQGGSLSDAQAKQVINVVLRLAATVAVGLLAAAFSAMAAGATVISVLWPAAVGAIVSGLCGVFGEAVQASRHSRPLEALLNEENTKLLFGLQELADCIRSLGQESRGHDEDLGLTRAIALAATLTSFRAEGLALMLDWEPNHEYVRRIRQTRSILANAAEVEAGNVAALGDLAERLDSAKWNLQQQIIPNDSRSYLASDQSSTPNWIESHAPSQAKDSTAAPRLDAVTYDETSVQTGFDSRSRTPGTLPALVDEYLRPSADSAAITDESAARPRIGPVTGNANTRSADIVSSDCADKTELTPEGRKDLQDIDRILRGNPKSAATTSSARVILEQAAEPDEIEANSGRSSIVEHDLGSAVNPLTEI